MDKYSEVIITSTKKYVDDLEYIAKDNKKLLKDLYQFLEFENQDKREKLKYKLDSLYIYQITTELIKQANSFETIKSEFDINNYNN